MAEIDVLKAQLVRDDTNTPWGFRLQGGAGSSTPLSIARIRGGSPAHRIGLQQGDEVTEIGDASTSAMTHESANELIKQYGLSLILTIERRARGAAHTAPKVIQSTVPMSHAPQAPSATYQPYDMTGKPTPVHYPAAARVVPAQRPQPRVDPNMEYHTASARVYDPPPTTGPRYQPPPPPPEPQPYGPPPPSAVATAVDGHQTYIPEEDKIDGPVQSRTFKILQSLMQNEEPYAGSSGLPPPRSASMEEWKRQEQAKRDSPRVKVFMPQTYNTPLGLYTTENIMDSFQKQAGAAMDQMDQYEPDTVSGAQRAVMEQEFNPPGASDL